MSHVVFVHTRKRPTFGKLLSKMGFDRHNTISGADWFIQVLRPYDFDKEEPPSYLKNYKTDLRFTVEIGIEPSGAPKAAYQKFYRAAKLLAVKFDGLVEDSHLIYIDGKTKKVPERLIEEEIKAQRASAVPPPDSVTTVKPPEQIHWLQKIFQRLVEKPPQNTSHNSR